MGGALGVRFCVTSKDEWSQSTLSKKGLLTAALAAVSGRMMTTMRRK
jgi:hypothetical protein